VLEEATSILGTKRRDRCAHRLDQTFPATGLGFAYEALDLAASLFDGVEVRWVGRQVQQLATLLLEELLNPLSFVSREVVHHHLTPAQRGRQDLLYVCLEDLAASGPSTASDGPIPETLILESRVVLGPRLRGTEQ
jgi:hypothetical protein